MPPLSDNQVALYVKRYQEGYDLPDPQYELWRKENHPGSDTDSLKTHVSHSSNDGKAKTHCTSSSDLSDILKYPERKPTSKARKPGINSSCAVCLSDSPVVQQLKQKEEQKKRVQEEKLRKKEECEKRREQMKSKQLKQKEKRKRRKQCETKKTQKELERQISSIQLIDPTGALSMEGGVALGGASGGGGDGVVTSEESDSAVGGDGASEEGEEMSGGDDCPVCHEKGLSCRWICCDYCDVWYHMHCTKVNPNRLPEIYYCSNCV